MQNKINELIKEALNQLKKIDNMLDLNQLRSAYLGKKSSFNQFMKELKNLPKEEKPKVGQMINMAKNEINQKIQERKEAIEKAEIEKQLKKETVDVTLPGMKLPIGKKHILTQTMRKLKIFLSGLVIKLKKVQNKKSTAITLKC